MATENTNNENERKYFVFFHDLQHDLVHIRAATRHIKLLKQKKQMTDAEMDTMLDEIDKIIEKASGRVGDFMRDLSGFRRKNKP